MENKKIKGFTCGAFDLCHVGHVLMLKECKLHCNYLIVGLQTDPNIDRQEKNKPVQSIEERHIMLEGIKYIDQVFVYTTEAELYSFLKENSMNIEVRIIGADWEGKKYTGCDLPIQVVFNSRDHGYSTSVLREKVCKQERLKDIK